MFECYSQCQGRFTHNVKDVLLTRIAYSQQFGLRAISRMVSITVLPLGYFNDVTHNSFASVSPLQCHTRFTECLNFVLLTIFQSHNTFNDSGFIKPHCRAMPFYKLFEFTVPTVGYQFCCYHHNVLWYNPAGLCVSPR